MNNLTKEDLELMSYGDIAELILKDEKKSLSTADIFQKICDVLELSKSTFENKIGGFYTALTTDKRFILLEDGTWDLKKNHSVKKLNLDDSFDDLEDEELENLQDEDMEESYEEEAKDIYDDSSDEDDDDVTDEYKDLVIVDEDELTFEENRPQF